MANTRPRPVPSPPEMPDRWLHANNDGTVIVPLRADDDGNIVEIKLREPSVDQLDEIMDLIEAADESLPKADATAADIAGMEPGPKKKEAREALDAHGRAMFKQRPHAEVFLKIVNLLKVRHPEEVTTAELPSWSVNPNACAGLLDHFSRPFAGPSMLSLGRTNLNLVQGLIDSDEE